MSHEVNMHEMNAMAHSDMCAEAGTGPPCTVERRPPSDRVKATEQSRQRLDPRQRGPAPQGVAGSSNGTPAFLVPGANAPRGPARSIRAASRRAFLSGAGAAGLLALAGCASGAPAGRESGSPAAAPPGTTIEALLEDTPFYVAHRGSGDNWPEHTMEAYNQAIAAGARAIEVSVNATRDGVLVCHHDRNTVRLTGHDHEIAATDYSVLEPLRNDARAWLGPASALQPIPLLREVLDAHASSAVIFIEDKQGTNTTALLELMDQYPHSREHFVWKQSAGGLQVRAVREAGYKTWGYFGAGTYDRIVERAGEFDFLGIDHLASDAVVRSLVARGKPVICWEVHRRHLRDRLVELGVRGLMCSNIPYVMGAPAPAGSDAFASGLRAAGDLPWTTDKGWSRQPRFRPETASLVLDGQETSSYCMGSMSPVEPDLFEIQVDLRWPDGLPGERQHAGVAFGQATDAPYRVLVESAVGGYHLVMRANGEVALFSRGPGEVSGRLLGSLQTAAVAAGEWVTLSLDVTGEGIGFARVDGKPRRAFVRSTRPKGGYLSLTRNYASGPPVEFRKVTVA